MDGYAYVLVLLEDVGSYVWLVPAKACTANFMVRQLVTWCAAFGAPKVWVSDNAAHFRNRVGREESGEEAGRATSMGSRQLSMDERDGREDEPRNPEDGEDDD